MQRLADCFQEQVSNWSELVNLVEHFSYFNGLDWIFRGIMDAAYGLVPKIGREEARGLKQQPGTGKRARLPYRLEDERAVFTMFKQQARAHLPSPPDSDLQWLALAQHFGLPTRLLDWTDNILAAAWFAVEKGGNKMSDSAIWVARGVPSVEIDYSGEVFTLADPMIYRPPHISPRIAAQGSVLMLCPKPTETVTLPFVKKIVIARSAEFTIKKRLSACGINRRHLFPDLSGLGDHLSWLYKNDWLAGYRDGKSWKVAHVSDDELDESEKLEE